MEEDLCGRGFILLASPYLMTLGLHKLAHPQQLFQAPIETLLGMEDPELESLGDTSLQFPESDSAVANSADSVLPSALAGSSVFDHGQLRSPVAPPARGVDTIAEVPSPMNRRRVPVVQPRSLEIAIESQSQHDGNLSVEVGPRDIETCEQIWNNPFQYPITTYKHRQV